MYKCFFSLQQHLNAYFLIQMQKIVHDCTISSHRPILFTIPYSNRVDWQGALRTFIGKVNGGQTNSHLIFPLKTKYQK